MQIETEREIMTDRRRRVDPHVLGLVIASLLAVWHALWAALVWLGVAQTLLDFVFELHMIAPVYHVQPFQWRIAAGLVLFTAAVGYLAGWMIGFVWGLLGMDESADRV